MTRSIVLLAIVGVLAAGTVAWGQAFPLGLLPTADEPVDAFVWTMESFFSVGDSIVIHLRVSRPAFVYLFDLQPDGVVRLLFPNAFSANNHITGAHQLPDAAYTLTAEPPTGIEELLVFATTMPLPFAPAAPTDPFPVFAEDPQQAIDTLVSLLDGLDPTSSWGVGWTAIQIEGSKGDQDEPTAGTLTVPSPPPLPPFAVGPGTSWHEAGGGWAYGIPAAGWYWHYGVDDRWHLCWVYED